MGGGIRTYAAPDGLESENRARREVRATPLLEMTKGRWETGNAMDENGGATISVCVVAKFDDRSPTAGSNFSSFILSGFSNDFTYRDEADGEEKRGRGRGCEAIRLESG